MMNRSVMNRQMFRRGGVVRMQEGGNAMMQRLIQTFEAKTGRPPTPAELQELIIMTRDITGPMQPSEPTMAVPEGQDFYPMPPEVLGPMTGGNEARPTAPAQSPQLPPKMNLEQLFRTPSRDLPPVKRQEGGPAARMPSDMSEMAASMPAAAAAMQGTVPAPQAEMAGAQVMDPAAVEQLMASAAQDVGDPETAQNYEEMMNMIRGDQATVEERRQELGMLVGPEDAQQTPESVLALVQPVVQIAAVDQGIGGLAEESMSEPVQGDMAGGIMSTVAPAPEPASAPGEGAPPVNFNKGGVVRPVQKFRVGGEVPSLESTGIDPLLVGPQRWIAEQMPTATPPTTAPEPRNRLREIVESQRDLYREYGLGDPEERARALEDQRRMSKAQMLFDIAQTALTFAAPMPDEPMGLSPAERLAMAASRTQLPQTIGARAQGILEAEQAARKEGRAIDLAALQSAEQKLTAEQEAAAAQRLAEAKARAAREKTLLEIQADVETGTAVDPTTGVSYETIMRKDVDPVTGKVFLSTEMKIVNGEPVIVDLPQGAQIIDGVDEDGNTIKMVVNPNIPGFKATPLTGPGGKPVVMKRAEREWQTLPTADGGSRVVLVDKDTKEPVPGYDSITVPPDLTVNYANGAVILTNNKTGEVRSVQSGIKNAKVLEINGTVVQLRPDPENPGQYLPATAADTLYKKQGAPELRQQPDGKFVNVYPPSEANPSGLVVPVHGSVPKAEKYDYDTWINVETGQRYNLFRVNDGKKLYFSDTAQEVPPSMVGELTRVSDQTSYDAAVGAKQARQDYDRFVRTITQELGGVVSQARLTDQQLSGYVNDTYKDQLNAIDNPAERAVFRQGKIAALKDARELANGIAQDYDLPPGYLGSINLMDMVEKGTGLGARILDISNRLWSSTAGALFDIGFFEAGEEATAARNFVRMIGLEIRLAQANSPRFAEAEQTRLAAVNPDVDAWLTTGRIEADKLRNIKSAILQDLTSVRAALAGRGGMARPSRGSPLDNQLRASEYHLSSALRLLTSVPALGVEESLTPEQQRIRDQKKAQQSGSGN